MPVASKTRTPRTLTPYAWCQHAKPKAKPGDRVLMLDKHQILTTFTIARIDHESQAVRWSLEGVWTDREWIELDKSAGYELIRAKKGSVK